jgi:hypothetical protein
LAVSSILASLIILALILELFFNLHCHFLFFPFDYIFGLVLDIKFTFDLDDDLIIICRVLVISPVLLVAFVRCFCWNFNDINELLI